MNKYYEIDEKAEEQIREVSARYEIFRSQGSDIIRRYNLSRQVVALCEVISKLEERIRKLESLQETGCDG